MLFIGKYFMTWTYFGIRSIRASTAGMAPGMVPVGAGPVPPTVALELGGLVAGAVAAAAAELTAVGDVTTGGAGTGIATWAGPVGEVVACGATAGNALPTVAAVVLDTLAAACPPCLAAGFGA